MKTLLTLLAVVLTTAPAFAQTQPGTQQPQRESEAGGQATQFSLTPQQFNQYANGPLSLFDHTAEQGIENNFAMLTGRQGTPAASARYAQAAGPGGVMSDATPAAPAIGYDPRVRTREEQAAFERTQETEARRAATIPGARYDQNTGKYVAPPAPPPRAPAPRLAPAPSVGTTACQRYPNLC